MKAYPLIWNHQNKYSNHIILLGTFHLACVYMKMIGKKMNGSGISDISIESGMIGSGSIEGVLSGKHYNRAIYWQKVLLEILERLLLTQFLAYRCETEVFCTLLAQSQTILDELLHNPASSAFQAAMADDGIQTFVRSFIQYRNDGKEGSR